MSKYTLLKADKILEHYKKSISTLRSGVINSSILDNITVEVWGSHMHIQELAAITKPEPMQLLITPYDKSTIKHIYKAISDSNLGVNPVDDGAGLRLIFTPPTEETKKRLVVELNKHQEEAKKTVRLERQDLIKDERAAKEKGDISEDDLKDFETKIQAEVDNLNKEIEEITKAKESEIMKV